MSTVASHVKNVEAKRKRARAHIWKSKFLMRSRSKILAQRVTVLLRWAFTGDDIEKMRIRSTASMRKLEEAIHAKGMTPNMTVRLFLGTRLLLSCETLAEAGIRHGSTIEVACQSVNEACEEKQLITSCFTCGRCKSDRCTFFQKQPRASDEPMVVIATCQACKNRWKIC